MIIKDEVGMTLAGSLCRRKILTNPPSSSKGHRKMSFIDIKKNHAIVAWFGGGLPMSRGVIPTERSEWSVSKRQQVIVKKWGG